MDASVDLLQIKIEQAKKQLPKEAREAIDAVDWREQIFTLRNKHGYNLEQMDSLELETELLLCGIVSAKNYPKELEAKMGIPHNQVEELTNELNELVFKKIRQKMIEMSTRTQDTSPARPVEIKVSTHTRKPNPSPAFNKDRLEITAPKITLATGGAPIVKMPAPAPAPSVEIKTEKKFIPTKLDLPEIEAPKRQTPDIKKSVEIAADVLQKFTAAGKTATELFGNAGIEIIKEKEMPKKPEQPLEERDDLMRKVENPESANAPEPVVPPTPKPTPAPAPVIPSAPVNVIKPLPSILAAKLSGAFKIQSVKTEHSLPGFSKTSAFGNTPSTMGGKIDPYRMSPDE